MTTILPALLLTGCSTSETSRIQEATSFSTSQDLLETRVALVDLLAVAERTKIGGQLLAESKGEIDQLTQQLAEDMSRVWQVDQAASAVEQKAAFVQRLNRIQVAEGLLFVKKAAPLNKLSKEVAPVVKPLAEKEGFTAILAKGTFDTFLITIYSKSTVDLTDHVVEELNKQSP